MFTPRQKKIVILLIIIIGFTMVKLVQEMKKTQDARKRQVEDAKWYSEGYQNLQEHGYSYDKDSPLAQSLDEYNRSEAEKKLRDQGSDDSEDNDSNDVPEGPGDFGPPPN